jgi:hypothetical protein
MGEMKIELKPDLRRVKHIPYQLNPRIKEKVKKEVDQMLQQNLFSQSNNQNGLAP